MYILFVFSLAITTVLVSAQQQQTTSGITSSSSDQHQLHLDETTQATTTTTSTASQHEQQSLFNNQSVQFGAEEKNDDEFRRTFDQQAATSIPLSQDKLDQQQQQQQQHQAATKETDPHSANRLSVTENFRLEFNKYKILSHLGITANPDELAPQLDEDLRTKLSATTAFTENSDPNKAVRHKRSLSCDQVNGNKNTCCLENFYVNFTHIGWDKWILYPAGYNANYCRGHCDLSHARYYHSTLLSKYSNIVSLCCSPKQMSSLRLLYIDENNKVHQKTIPDMVVESCDCA